ncbi:hypothetical protein IE077_002628 [Cardiosporidium cionae]|uniref:PCIF1 WW domain-containing protein n=1 Tax=Cardiosporidium cionae TaxID=476202 RepID=A0ABQ7JAJ2_9APIC|nr:hypothetical protein IE077_002628 [Cardiosporidium cionae]|eukprot:KAF8820949.1 hypothetical protein IE077_002628 [Cardiosporidium cionae]
MNQNKILPYEGCEFESKDVNKTKNLRSKWEQLNRTDWYDCTREIWTVRSYAEPLIFCVHSQQIENLYTTFNLAVLEAERKVSQCDFRSLSKDYDSKQVIRKSNLKETNSWKPSWKKNDESSRSFIPSVNMKIKSFSTAKIDSFRPHLSGHVPMSSCNELSKAIGMESSCASVIWELANQMSRFFLSSGCKKQFENLCGVDCLSTEKITSFSIGHHLVEKLWKRYSATLNKRNTMHKKEWIHLDSMNLSGDAYKYVKAIYENADSAQREEFSESIFKLLLRYHTICDPEEFSGIGLQSAVPSQFLALLREYFEVECECFASPFNSALNSYYSAFYDTDNDFGSYGSFFADDVKLDSGSYEANPPFDEFVIDRMADRFLQFLREASGPLSFAIVVPDWDNAECLYLEKLLSNEFFQDTFVALPKKHFFISGVFDGELSRQTTLKLIPKSPNRFILLQNEIARSKWPCSAEKMLKLRKAWMLQEEQPRHSHLKWRE